MTAWVWPAVILIAGLFAIKITYVLSDRCPARHAKARFSTLKNRSLRTRP
ncbi:MAG: hypothetical protein SWH61_01820 [Thermodesulfobacteriota bacterium]|nr:hypothetical protein [Thermodesulfobacteriota bacterium]